MVPYDLHSWSKKSRSPIPCCTREINGYSGSRSISQSFQFIFCCGGSEFLFVSVLCMKCDCHNVMMHKNNLSPRYLHLCFCWKRDGLVVRADIYFIINKRMHVLEKPNIKMQVLAMPKLTFYLTMIWDQQAPQHLLSKYSSIWKAYLQD